MGLLIDTGLRVLKPTRSSVRPIIVHTLLIQRSLVVGSRDGWKPIEPNRPKDSRPVGNGIRSSVPLFMRSKYLLKSGIVNRPLSTSAQQGNSGKTQELK